MRMQRWKEVLAVVLACSSGTAALGGDIAYRVGTGPEVRVTVSNTAPYTPVALNNVFNFKSIEDVSASRIITPGIRQSSSRARPQRSRSWG